ncbi:diacylglyceryl transferase [Antarcticibacterium arcticum]|uniref:Diacylglyceryl transferase n=1 Tax=Antarcticibacterium arcticum TaxID=2585771 RepID=A0A5B8YLF6_9FLAO|nr:DUF6787 family protein [Antarcticibacterium arcticum]QED37096.1 diacylglyceryl transferase [Antarcticibacterium arcticum]
MNKLKKRWGIESNFQIVLILIVFAITGSTSAKLAGPLCDLLGFNQENSPWYLYWFLRIVLIFPIYQVLLVFFGWVFGQFEFFWQFEKKMLSRLGFSRFFN